MEQQARFKFIVSVFENRDEMGKAAAKDAGASLRDALKENKEVNCIFAAAPSQNEFLKYLAMEELEWNRVNAFHMDEYIGLKNSDSRSFSSFLNEHIFSLLSFKNVFYINGAAEDIDKEIERYESLLKDHPVDFTFMGIGENGHIAFNDPHVARFDDDKLIKIVDLDEKSRMQQVHDKCFCSFEETPKYALTLTIPALVEAKKLFCMVPASTKADAVKRTVMGEISEKCPATIMRKHGDAALYLDADSAKYIL